MSMIQILDKIKKYLGIYVIFVDVSRSLGVLIDSTLQKFHWCKMTAKGPKILIKS